MASTPRQPTRKGAPMGRAAADEAGDLPSFLQNILESSTEYSIIGKDLNGTILLWNEGARRLYGYGPTEVVGKANLSLLRERRRRTIIQATLDEGEATTRRRIGVGHNFTVAALQG